MEDRDVVLLPFAAKADISTAKTSSMQEYRTLNKMLFSRLIGVLENK